VSDTGSLRSSARDTTARDAVVRPLARAAQRACVRPGCPSPARASLTFRYDSREAWIERLSEEPRPEAYDLCASHATRTHPPHGWQLRDRRPREEQGVDDPPPAPADLGGEQTVALLAAALRSVPDPGPTREVAEVPAAATAEAEPLEDTSSPVLEPLRSPSVADVGDSEPDASADHEQLRVDPETPKDAPETPRGEPRPVLAARERRVASERDRAPDGPARDW
jgi:hypothetical protein